MILEADELMLISKSAPKFLNHNSRELRESKREEKKKKKEY